MDFAKIVDRAFKLVRNHTVLWKLGLLAVFTEGISSSFIPGPPVPADSTPAAQTPDPALERIANDMRVWVEANWSLTIAAGVILTLLVIWFWYISIRAKAGLILSAEKLEANQPAGTFKEASASGRPFTGRIIGLYLLTLLFGTVVLGGLSAVLATISQPAMMIAFVCLLPIFIAVVAYANFIVKIAERHIVLADTRTGAAIAFAHQVLRNRLGQSVISVLIEFGLQILFLLAIFSIIMISVGIGALLAILIASVLPKAVVVGVVGVLALILLVGFFILSGWFSAFIISYWTLVYRAFHLLHNKKGA